MNDLGKNIEKEFHKNKALAVGGVEEAKKVEEDYDFKASTEKANKILAKMKERIENAIKVNI